MVNSREFAKRLENIFDYYDLNASSFADAIDVGRSSISHILSGRNKPSLDFVMRIVSTYDEVDLYWLLNGKGGFPKSEQSESSNSTTQLSEKVIKNSNTSEPENLFSNPQENIQKQQHVGISQSVNSKEKAIQKIVVLYKDGSFEVYEN